MSPNSKQRKDPNTPHLHKVKYSNTFQKTFNEKSLVLSKHTNRKCHRPSKYLTRLNAAISVLCVCSLQEWEWIHACIETEPNLHWRNKLTVKRHKIFWSFAKLYTIQLEGVIQFYWGCLVWREISAGRPAAAYVSCMLCVLHAHAHTHTHCKFWCRGEISVCLAYRNNTLWSKVSEVTKCPCTAVRGSDDAGNSLAELKLWPDSSYLSIFTWWNITIFHSFRLNMVQMWLQSTDFGEGGWGAQKIWS